MKVLIKRLKSTCRRWYYWRLYRVGGIQAVANRLRFADDPVPILRQFGAHVGQGTIIYPGLTIHGTRKDFSNLWVGDNSRILRDVVLDLTERIELGDCTGVGIRNALITHFFLPPTSPLDEKVVKRQQGAIVFEKGAVALTSVTVLHGVTLGQGSIAGAGTVISRDLPAHSTCWNDPPRVVRRRPSGSDAEG